MDPEIFKGRCTYNKITDYQAKIKSTINKNKSGLPKRTDGTGPPGALPLNLPVLTVILICQTETQ